MNEQSVTPMMVTDDLLYVIDAALLDDDELRGDLRACGRVRLAIECEGARGKKGPVLEKTRAFVTPVSEEARLVDAVEPGGTFFYLGHDPANIEFGVGGPQDPDLLPSVNAIVSALLGFEIVTGDGHAYALSLLSESSSGPVIESLSELVLVSSACPAAASSPPSEVASPLEVDIGTTVLSAAASASV